jgi:methylmalonyl-CoA mutase N-terminal domain/subunit
LRTASNTCAPRRRPGSTSTTFAPRLSFFFVARTTLLEEVAKFRAARRVWAKIMKRRVRPRRTRNRRCCGSTPRRPACSSPPSSPRSTSSASLQGLAAVLGGTQSLHTNSFDEAIALPTQKAARLALRTQQVIAYETDVCKTVDPFAGSYVVESLTDELEAKIWELIQAVEDKGGAVKAIEQGFQKQEIERSAYRTQLATDSGERIVVGLNKFRIDAEEKYDPLRVDPAIEAEQCARLEKLRKDRDNGAVDDALTRLKKSAEQPGGENLLIPMREALAARATGGEVSNALRDVWGQYVPTDAF